MLPLLKKGNVQEDMACSNALIYAFDKKQHALYILVVYPISSNIKQQSTILLSSFMELTYEVSLT